MIDHKWTKKVNLGRIPTLLPRVSTLHVRLLVANYDDERGQTDRQKHIQTDSQTDRQRDIQTDRQTH